MPYYLDQTDWKIEDYRYLHRYLHRMFFYHNKRMAEIESIDLSKTTNTTRVIMYCIIKYYKYDFLLDMINLSKLKKCVPLESPLILDEDTLNEDDIYKTMNIIY